jgi:uncharacterized protein with von Willebrand factor type A (vWA) domain
MSDKSEGMHLRIDSLLDLNFEEEGDPEEAVRTAPKKTSSKEYGRWNIYESQRYLEVVRSNEERRNIIKQLKRVLPNRG